ncbi:hypothetical protein [Candidatus Tisiphia endosymbiont of Micropterix aruncella]|uniref:hypothetical protein n=1 Tax=Candidatus Tisiphia endosymbiont of Micropterix aruncella TaxID=3066271 RepID=UPI003AA8B6EF
MYYPLLVILAFSIITIGQILLILRYVKWLNSIRLTYNNISSSGKEFANTYTRAKGELDLLHQDIKKLTTLIAKKEHHLLHTTFHLEEMQTCITILLDEFREFVKLSKPKERIEKKDNNQHT